METGWRGSDAREDRGKKGLKLKLKIDNLTFLLGEGSSKDREWAPNPIMGGGDRHKSKAFKFKMGDAYWKRAEPKIEGGGRGCIGKEFDESSNSTDSEMHRHCY